MEIVLPSTKELTPDHISELCNRSISAIIMLTDDEVDRMINQVAWTHNIKKYIDIIDNGPIILVDNELDMKVATDRKFIDSMYFFRSNVGPTALTVFIGCFDILDFSDSIDIARRVKAFRSMEWRFTEDQLKRVSDYIKTLRDVIML